MLTGWITDAAGRYPDRAAIVQGPVRVSWSELAQRIDRFAAGLAALGVETGDALALVLPNRPEFVVAFFAAMRLGAIVAPAAPGSSEAELDRILSDAAPGVVICDRTCLEVCAAVARRLVQPPRLIIADDTPASSGLPDFEHFEFAAVGAGLPSVPNRGAGDARALYLYTSGSTDSFKRVCCTQSNLYYEALNFVSSTRQTVDDTIFCAVPLYHSYGMGNGLLDAAFCGATLVLEDDTISPFATRVGSVLKRMRAETVRVFLGVPFQYGVLAASSEDIASGFADVRWCVSSGDALPRRVFDAFRERTGRPVRSLYGSTEAASIAMPTGPDESIVFGDLGAPLANVEIEVRGESGELWIKSPTLPPGGYDNRPDLNAVVFRDGFYNSGDLGRIDADGHLWMTGRKQSFVDIGGHKVDLAEVEEVLLAHPKVREAAAVGVEIPGVGHILKAVVSAEESCRAVDILDHCRRVLTAFKVPRLIEFRQSLPRSPLGKVLKPELLETEDWLAQVPSARDIPPGSRVSRTAWLAHRVREQVAAMLACHAEDIPCDAPLQALGLDSLHMVELQERLSRISGVALSVLTLWNYPSIDAYAAFLLDAMAGPEGAPSEQAGLGAVAATGAGDELDDVADEDIAAMLSRELTGGT